MLEGGIWNEGEYDSFEWQPSPPNTPYVVPSLSLADTLVDNNISVTDSGSIAHGSLSSISNVETLTFDRLIWNIQSWEQSTWQTSPPEYPLLNPTSVAASTLDIAFGDISVRSSKSSITATPIQSSEDVVFDRLSWNRGLWDKSSWQTSPPEFPELSVPSISVTTFDTIAFDCFCKCTDYHINRKRKSLRRRVGNAFVEQVRLDT
jgi:hypothetical protein